MLQLTRGLMKLIPGQRLIGRMSHRHFTVIEEKHGGHVIRCDGFWTKQAKNTIEFYTNAERLFTALDQEEL